MSELRDWHRKPRRQADAKRRKLIHIPGAGYVDKPLVRKPKRKRMKRGR